MARTGLWERLKRRKFVQRGLAYLAVAWAVLEGLGFLSDTFAWHEAVVRAATMALATGFLVALILAWYHGEKGYQRVQRLELALLVATVLAGAGATSAVTLRSLSASAEEPPPGAAATDGRELRAGWVAVLPFRNLSGDPDQEFFSSGITQEITVVLNSLGGLRVISPGSVARFHDREDLSPGQIGRMLGVSTLVDGSVRAAGGVVRVAAQLVDARTEEQLWADAYDRQLTTAALFDIQSEIASRIGEALRLTGTGAGARSERPTEDLEAYNAYLQGLYYFNQAGPGSLAPSIGEYERALAIDPEFALAHAGLAAAWLANAHFGMPPHRAFPEGIRHAELALRLDSMLADAHTVLADARFHYEWDWEGAEREFRRAIELQPTFSTAHWWYGGLLAALGRFEEATEQVEMARAMDPLSPLGLGFASRVYTWAGRPREAETAAREALELNPRAAMAHAALGGALLEQGRAEEAVASLREAVRLAEPVWLARLVGALAAVGDSAEARRARDRLEALAARETESWYVPPYQLAIADARLGRPEAALDELEAAVESRDAELIWVAVEPVFDGLRRHRRFRALLRRLGLEEAGASTLSAGRAGPQVSRVVPGELP